MSTDAFDLERFVQAQESDFERAISEIKAGRKQTHWMWYIFPQLEGLGSSRVSAFYAISGVGEAEAYLAHPVLGPRLLRCAEAVLLHKDRATASAIFGFPDDLKLRSSATLFARVSLPGSVFHQIIDAFFQGRPDETTGRRLESTPSSPSSRPT